MNEKSAKYRTEIQQMMFVSGETGEPSPETTTLIESVVQDQVREMLRKGTELATRRGSRAISTDDFMMLIRHDKAKVSRLRNFLQWKDVRRTAKDQSDDKGGDEIVPDEAPAGGAVAPTGPLDVKRNKKARVDLPWDVPSFFSEQVPPRDDEEDEEEEESNYATLQRLRAADERTKDMSREEYVHWSECRQASFTFRKGKRFREWAGFGVITEAKPNDDIIDILGFLTFEMVQTLTEEALKVKAVEDIYKKQTGSDGSDRKRKREPGLFDGPDEAREPVGPSHIREAFRRLQMMSNKQTYLAPGRRALMGRSIKIF